MSELEPRLRADGERALGRPLDDLEVAALFKYLNLLLKWQKSQRLVGSSDPAWILEHVIVDSLLFARLLPDDLPGGLCDVGSGAGVPGIPLKVILPAAQVALVESRQKRASFLSAAVREIPLRDCRVINRRLEDVCGELAGRFDVVVMRCAGSPDNLTSSIVPLLRPGGRVVASGPPTDTSLAAGEWRQIQGPYGQRRFWTYQAR